MNPKNPFKLEGAQPLSEKALAALDRFEPSRRDFLKTAGVMMIGFGVGAATVSTAEAQSPINPSGSVDATQLDNWVAVGADESITVFAGKAELGTGMRTVQLQLAAEELSVPVDRITLVLCRSGVTPNQGLTVGSLSTMTQFGTAGLRVAVDTARDALYQLASLWLDVPASQLSLKDGVFSINGGDPTLTVSYGQLVEGRRFNLPVNPKAVPNDPSTWKVLGQSVPRVDIPSKAKGTFQYVHKVRVPGMLHGRVIRPPNLGAHVQNIDSSVLNGLPGNPQVVRVIDFVGVVADTEWHAIKAEGVQLGEWYNTAPFRGHALAVPSDRPDITYVLARFGGVEGQHLISEMYAPDQVTACWFAKTDVRLIAVDSTTKTIVDSNPTWFAYIGTMDEAKWQVYRVSAPPCPAAT